ncbi:glutathione S-transferase N-terminal domain-containing protein [Solimonas soli]|uniref:glutathione S-transferase N-terminal domain-containing protein n=1 Tax=Solimonas soli TaxID=413479 RepID=UPI000480B5D5|nr:glutathione S-transferase N-terminal domain-containing protein [Solimonas soli]
MRRLPRFLDVIRSVLASTAAGWRGTLALHPAGRQPAEPLRLYDIEACPYCRLVRETLSELDLDVLVYPCPAAVAAGGKAQFPLLVDPNTGRTLYESADIVEYLAATYTGRAGGLRARASRAAAQPLELYSFEASPYSRLVRERLCELELPYLLRNAGKGRLSDMGAPSWRDRVFKGAKGSSRNRRGLLERSGHVQLPYLVDPNTGAALFESAAILDHLDAHYAA